MTLAQLLGLAYETVAEAAPDSLKKNSTLRQLGRLMAGLDEYAELCVQSPAMSGKGKEALARAERLGKLWIRKDCGCK